MAFLFTFNFTVPPPSDKVSYLKSLFHSLINSFVRSIYSPAPLKSMRWVWIRKFYMSWLRNTVLLINFQT